MRPPLNAGENPTSFAISPACSRPASMRPPLNAGENRMPRGRLPSPRDPLQ